MRIKSSAIATINIATSKSHSNPVKAQVVNWMFLCDMLRRVVPGSKGGHGYVAAQLPDGRRTNARVINTSLLVFDLDNKASTVTQADLIKKITDSEYLAILHSTYSHIPEHPRFRLVLAISEPIKPSDHKSVLLQVAQNLGISDFIDNACTDVSRYFYLPRCPSERVKDFVFWSNDGDPINVAACLNRISSNLSSSTALSFGTTESGSKDWQENPSNIAKIKEWLGYCPADCEYEIWRNIIWSVCSLNWRSGNTLVQDWSRTSHHHWSDTATADPAAEIDKLMKEFDANRGISVGTLIGHARANGWRPNSNSDNSAISSAQPIVAESQNLSTSERVQKLPSSIDRVDIRNGERFREHFHGTLLFVRDTDHVLQFDPDTGWIRGNSDLPMQSAKEVVARMTEACARAIAEGKDVKRMLSDVKRSSCRRALDDMLTLAKSEPGMSVALSELDSDPYLLGVKNGVVDLKTGLLLAPNPERLVTKYCNINFDDQARCPQFCAFLAEVVPIAEQRKFLVLAMGYFLTGLTHEQLWFFFHGVGSNGKSVLISLLEFLMGDYATKIPTEMLMQNNRNSGGPEPDKLLLQGKRLVFANETKEGQRLDDAKLKDLTGGDTITARPLYAKQYISFPPTHKLVVIGNYHPTVSDDSHGFWRRIVLFPFSVCVPKEKQDQKLIEKLKNEGPGILNYLLKGLSKNWKHGLKVPNSLANATREYRTDQDFVQQFLIEKCVIDDAKTISKINLYNRYKFWCSANGFHALSSIRFSRKLTGKGFKVQADKRTWIGVGCD